MTFALDASFLPSCDRPIDQSCRAPTREQRIDQMESKFDSCRSMPKTNARERARPIFEELVAEQQKLKHSRMQAYRAVGRLLNRSESWVRRLLGGVDVAFLADQQDALAAAYAAYCKRTEDRAARVLAAAKHRKENADAIVAGLHGIADRLGERPSEPAHAVPGAIGGETPPEASP